MNFLRITYGRSYKVLDVIISRAIFFLSLMIIGTPAGLFSQSSSFQTLDIHSDLYYGELDTGILNLSPYLGYYYEKGETVNIEAVIKGLENPNFQSYAAGLLPNDKWDVYWITMEIHNEMDQTAELSLACFADHSILYMVQPDNSLRIDTADFSLPISRWPAMQNIPAVYDAYTIPLQIPPHAHVSLFLKVRPHFYYGFDDRSISLRSKQSYLKNDLQYVNVNIRRQALLQGMFLMTLLFNLLKFFNGRDLTYLFCSLYTASIAYCFLLIFGYDRLWLWGVNEAYMPVGQNLAVYGIGIFYALFCIYFLHKGGWRPKIKKLLTYLVYFAMASAVISSAILLIQPRLDPRTISIMNVLFLPIGILGTLFFLYVNVVYLFSKSRLAKFFAAAGLIMFAGILSLILYSNFQILNLMGPLNLEVRRNFPTVIILEVACITQILFFALVLSYRMHLIDKDKPLLE